MGDFNLPEASENKSYNLQLLHFCVVPNICSPTSVNPTSERMTNTHNASHVNQSGKSNYEEQTYLMTKVYLMAC